MPRLSLFPLLLTGALAACGGDGSSVVRPPQWIDLSRGFRPGSLEELALRLEEQVQPPRGGHMLRLGDDHAQVWFEVPLPRESWRQIEPRIWAAPLPTGGAVLAGEAVSAVVLDGKRELEKGFTKRMHPEHFALTGTEVRLSVAEGAEPAKTLAYRLRLDHGREVDGAWRVAQWDLACSGFLAFPGVPEKIAVEIPPASRLCFASVSPDPGGRGEKLAPTTFRVKLDGRTILERQQSYRHVTRSEWNQVALDTSGAHELSFEVDGPAPALIATPHLAPAAIGKPGERPWKEERPDLVLVLCDTFRADNLAAWGGAPELAPHLNRFVERSLRFLDARSAAAWTLPSIATMLSGVFPAQHGATDMDRGVSDHVETVAEVLGRAGYRTAALTDSGLFSRYFGQDQGFQWFQEAQVDFWNLGHTLERARQQLGGDDGRPLFLLVHTYRVHGPMRLGPEEDIKPYHELRERIRARVQERKQSEGRQEVADVAMEFLDEGIRFYHDAVSDLDRKVGGWIEELERDGFLERGCVVLTSDHGNAHGEHGQIGHGSDLFDVKLRVPLALAGAGIPERAVHGPVSLIDLAPTLAAIARVSPDPSWVGRSLLGDRPGRPIYAFDFRKTHTQLALYSGGRKLMADDVAELKAGQPTHAYDLAKDPAEDDNLAAGTAWPAELGRALVEALEPLTVPAADARMLELSPEIKAQLEAIGYGQ